MSVRNQLLDALLDVLAPLRADGKVKTLEARRVGTFAPEELPAVSVRLGDERIDRESLDWPYVERHEVEVAIEIRVRAEAGVAYRLNVLGADVSALMGSADDGLLNGGWVPVSLVDDEDDAGEMPCGMQRCVYQGTYYVRSDEPRRVIQQLI
jgi:hypothetical protein